MNFENQIQSTKKTSTKKKIHEPFVSPRQADELQDKKKRKEQDHITAARSGVELDETTRQTTFWEPICKYKPNIMR
jgi:hypothetical protein